MERSQTRMSIGSQDPEEVATHEERLAEITICTGTLVGRAGLQGPGLPGVAGEHGRLGRVVLDLENEPQLPISRSDGLLVHADGREPVPEAIGELHRWVDVDWRATQPG